jgi:hypothetical protein
MITLCALLNPPRHMRAISCDIDHDVDDHVVIVTEAADKVIPRYGVGRQTHRTGVTNAG